MKSLTDLASLMHERYRDGLFQERRAYLSKLNPHTDISPHASCEVDIAHYELMLLIMIREGYLTLTDSMPCPDVREKFNAFVRELAQMNIELSFDADFQYAGLKGEVTA